jgi:hypothetical protein
MLTAGENLSIAKYLQGRIPLAECIQLMKLSNFPKPSAHYKQPFASEQLTNDFSLEFPVSQLLTKEELAAETLYLAELRDWVKENLNETKKRHEQELETLKKQMAAFITKKSEPTINKPASCEYYFFF